MTASYWFGWLFLVSSTFAIDHFDLFGLRQGLKMGNFLKFYNDEEFVTNYHYKYVRHPIMTGFFLMFWSIQSLTIGIVSNLFNYDILYMYNILYTLYKGRILFAGVASGYILFAVKVLEEPDLIKTVGKTYENYMKTTPSFCPIFNSTKKNK